MNKLRRREFKQLVQKVVIVKLNPKMYTSRGQVFHHPTILLLDQIITTPDQIIPKEDGNCNRRGTGYLKA